MSSMKGAPPLPPPIDEAATFQVMLDDLSKQPRSKESHTKFVKKVDSIPSMPLLVGAKRTSLAFSEQDFNGNFTGMWSSHHSMDLWIDQTRRSKTKGDINLYARGNKLFAFLFELKEDRDAIFRDGPYFFGSRGMYLNKWMMDFNPNEGIRMMIHVWRKLPRLPLSC